MMPMITVATMSEIPTATPTAMTTYTEVPEILYMKFPKMFSR